MPISNAVHKHPDECLPFLDFEYNDGGREDYFRKLLKTGVPKGIGDCAVVAVSLATLVNPDYKSPALSYHDALDALTEFNHGLKPWKRRRFRETKKKYIWRRFKEILVEQTCGGIPKHQNPIYGTDTNTYSAYLTRMCGYTLVFGEPCMTEQFCLCAAKGTLVLDGRIKGRGEHSTAIIKQKIVDGINIGGDDIDFHVIHVWERI